MKKLLAVLLFVLLSFCVPALAAPPTTTVMVYMCASDMYDAALYDLLEMCEADLGSQVQVAVMAGGAQDWEDILEGVQPIFLDYDLHVLEERVGAELGHTSYAFGSQYRRGVHLSFGTDCPVEECDPFANLYCAVTRCDKQGWPEGGYAPEEKMDIYDAVDAYTIESAYMQFMEDRKGRLLPGYLADFAVLDRDIFTIDPKEIMAIQVDLTAVDGTVVYER